MSLVNVALTLVARPLNAIKMLLKAAGQPNFSLLFRLWPWLQRLSRRIGVSCRETLGMNPEYVNRHCHIGQGERKGWRPEHVIGCAPLGGQPSHAPCQACAMDLLQSQGVRPISLDHVARYFRHVHTSTVTQITQIAPVTTSFRLDGLPQGWEIFMHPEGTIYFHHSQKHISTKADLYDERIWAKIDGYIQLIEDVKVMHVEPFPLDHELVVELGGGDNGDSECYY